MKIKVIDTHVHARDLDQSNISTVKETIKLANLGGIGTLCFMPNTTPAIVNLETLEEYINLIKSTNLGKHYIYFGLTENNLNECEEALKREEVVGLKVYPLGVTTGEGSVKAGISDHSILDKAMLLVIKYNKVISFHGESAEIISELGHVPEAEIDYFKNIIANYGIKYPQAKMIAAHASLKESVKPLIEARKEGANISIELTAHHIWFTLDDALNNPFLKCFPPLRTKEDRDYLRNLLKSNEIPIMFGSDHAPHLRTAKLSDNPPGGIPNLGDAVGIFLTICNDIGLEEEKIKDILYNNAFNLLNIAPNDLEATFTKEKNSSSNNYYDDKVENPFKNEIIDFRI